MTPRALLLIAALTAAAPAQAADDPTPRCYDSAPIKDAVETKHGRWQPQSAAQLNFLRGISAMAPSTPPGIPMGDGAALIQLPNDDGGMAIFLDGERICLVMSVPEAVVKMLGDVGTARHEGGRL